MTTGKLELVFYDSAFDKYLQNKIMKISNSRFGQHIFNRSRHNSLRTRLLSSFILLALLPAMGISIASVIIGYSNGRQQALARLESVQSLKMVEISTYCQALEGELNSILTEEYAADRTQVVLNMGQKYRFYDFYSGAIRSRYELFVKQSPYLKGLSLLDLNGHILLSTDLSIEGKDESGQAYFQAGLKTAKVGLPFSPLQPATVDVAIPVASADGVLLGVLSGNANLDKLNEILGDSVGLGNKGWTYLVDADHHLLRAANGFPIDNTQADHVASAGIDSALGGNNTDGVYYDFRGKMVIGVYHWMPDLGIAIVTEQEILESFQSILTNIMVNLGIALVALILAVGSALLLVRDIANPLVRLVETTTQIAGGDIEQEAEVSQVNEIGALALAINSMTSQLRNLIGSLERRVEERTASLRKANQSLQRQTLQLKTSAQVSREITSILDIDELLKRVVSLIRDAFGYYQVQIYLADKETRQLQFRAGTGTLPPQHRILEFGAGNLNGEAAQNNKALMINDLAVDMDYLADPNLPDTRAELVIPLRMGGQVTGTIDVHSASPEVFSEEDLLVIQSLADQIAIAIENARLYDQSKNLAVLEERNRLGRELHDSVTQSLYSLSLLAEGLRRLVGAGEQADFDENLSYIVTIAQTALKEMRLLIYELRPPDLEQEGLIGALRQRLEAVEKRSGVQTRLVISDELILIPVVEEGIFGIVQEALNNALKHAQAKNVSVIMDKKDKLITLEVIDDGQGFIPGVPNQGGMGLVTMRERAEKLGGNLEIQTGIGKGTTIRIRFRMTNTDSERGMI
jgi:signal transduction histidine kinase